MIRPIRNPAFAQRSSHAQEQFSADGVMPCRYNWGRNLRNFGAHNVPILRRMVCRPSAILAGDRFDNALSPVRELIGAKNGVSQFRLQRSRLLPDPICHSLTHFTCYAGKTAVLGPSTRYIAGPGTRATGGKHEPIGSAGNVRDRIGSCRLGGSTAADKR
jgi:hypothetical protein